MIILLPLIKLLRGDMIIRNRSLPKSGNGYGASPLRRFRFSAGILVKKKKDNRDAFSGLKTRILGTEIL